MTGIALDALTKRFDDVVAVDDVRLEVRAGELFFLLGPSGCGKTTLLRMIGGFTEPTAGRIAFGARDVTRVPASRRNVGMVFQSFALWPHMTVAENVGYGLRVRRVARAERNERVEAALRMVRMEDEGDRRPVQLSGGQQQRVALARALAVRPSVLLLDEPLSNLDARLREAMRAEIRRICRETGITTVYVTHDQREALSMADRIAIMRAGRVEQVADPRTLYRHPSSAFVAAFVGETNLLPATVTGADGAHTLLATAAGPLRAVTADPRRAPGDRVVCSIRPEAIRLGDPPAAAAGWNRLVGRRAESVFQGDFTRHRIVVGEVELAALEVSPRVPRDDGPAVTVSIEQHDIVMTEDRG